MREGPTYCSHSLGDGSKHHRRKGLKTVCITPRCTSESPMTKMHPKLGHSQPHQCMGPSLISYPYLQVEKCKLEGSNGAGIYWRWSPLDKNNTRHGFLAWNTLDYVATNTNRLLLVRKRWRIPLLVHPGSYAHTHTLTELQHTCQTWFGRLEATGSSNASGDHL